MKIPLSGDEIVVISAVFGAAFRFFGTRKEAVRTSVAGFIAGLFVSLYVVHPLFVLYGKQFSVFQPGASFLAAACGLSIVNRFKVVTPGIVEEIWVEFLTRLAGAILPKPKTGKDKGD